MTEKRRVGRPKGARGKKSPLDEITKAHSRGAGLVELKELMWKQLTDEKVTDQQKSKIYPLYLELMKFIHGENMKIAMQGLSNSTSKKKDDDDKVDKGENAGKESSPSTGTVVYPKMSFSKK